MCSCVPLHTLLIHSLTSSREQVLKNTPPLMICNSTAGVWSSCQRYLSPLEQPRSKQSCLCACILAVSLNSMTASCVYMFLCIFCDPSPFRFALVVHFQGHTRCSSVSCCGWSIHYIVVQPEAKFTRDPHSFPLRSTQHLHSCVNHNQASFGNNETAIYQPWHSGGFASSGLLPLMR